MTTLFNRFLLTALLSLTLLASCSSKDPAAEYQNHVEQAQQLISQEKWPEARIHLMSAIDLKPKEAENYFQLAEVLVRLQKFAAALENYRSAVNYNPDHIQARLRIAGLLLAGNETELAESEARKVLEKDPQNTEALIITAAIDTARSNFDRATKVLHDVISREPKNATAIASLGDLAMKQGQLDEAEKYFRQALEIKPDMAPVQLAMADLAIRMNRYDDAQKLMENLLTKAPDNAQLRFLLAEFMLSRGNSERALNEYKKVLETDPMRYDARDRLYDMYLTNNDTASAIALAKALEEKNPQDSLVSYFKGREQELLHNEDAALELYLKALEGSRNFAPAFRRVGRMEIARGQTREGMEHLNQAIAIDPYDVGARLTLGQYFFSKGDYATALDHVNKVLQRFPRQLGANILRADLALVEGKPEQARKAYELLTQAFPESPVGWFKLGVLELRDKNIEKAIENYEKALSFDVGVLVPARHLTQILLSQKGMEAALAKLQELKSNSKNSIPEYDFLIGALTAAAPKASPEQIAQARRSLEDAVRGRPELIDAYTVLAQLDAREGDNKGAIMQYQHLVDAQPQSIPYNMLLGVALEREKEFSKAADVYRKVLTINARFGPAANNLAWLMAEELHDNIDEALRLALVAKEEMPTDPNVADTLGWVYYKKGSYRAALTMLNEGRDIIRKDDASARLHPELLYHLGATKLKLGDTEGAKADLNEALKSGGKDFARAADVEKLLSEVGNTAGTAEPTL